MILRPQVPSNCYGTRLSICVILALIVACFFLGYDAIAHRGNPIVPGATHASDYQVREIRPGNIPGPDMASQEVEFANADVPPANDQSVFKPTQSNIATTAAEGQAKKKDQVRKVERKRTASPAQHTGRTRMTRTIRNTQEGRAAYAQGFFGSAPFGGF
jgi:hypothetical protein